MQIFIKASTTSAVIGTDRCFVRFTVIEANPATNSKEPPGLQ